MVNWTQFKNRMSSFKPITKIYPSTIFCLSEVRLLGQQVQEENSIPHDNTLQLKAFPGQRGVALTQRLQGLLPVWQAGKTSKGRYPEAILIWCLIYLNWLPLAAALPLLPPIWQSLSL